MRHRSPDQVRTIFGENLRALTNEFPSISEFARRLGLNRTQLNRYLAGESFPRPDVLDKICERFGLDARILLEPLDSVRVKIARELQSDDAVQPVDQDGERGPIIAEGYYEFIRLGFEDPSNYVRHLVSAQCKNGQTRAEWIVSQKVFLNEGVHMPSPRRRVSGALRPEGEGFSILASRDGKRSSVFCYLAQIDSMSRALWAGYVSRAARNMPGTARVAGCTLRYIGDQWHEARKAARAASVGPVSDLLQFQQGLLRSEDPRFSAPKGPHIRDDGTAI